MDSWALGVLLYTLVYGTMPFDGFDHKNLIRQISSGEYREPTQPSGACPVEGGPEVEGRKICLPTLIFCFCFSMSVWSLLVFLFLLPRSIILGKACLLGCFPQTFPKELFRTHILGVLFACCVDLGKSLTLFGFRFSTINTNFGKGIRRGLSQSE